MIGGKVVRLGAVTSTNDAAARLAAEGEAAGTAVVAEEQLAGRGRQGRPWHSPAGLNIYCSLILRPSRPVREWPGLSWTLAAAVAAFARECGAAGAAVKYPNDVLASGRKLAGLLLESRTCGDGQAALIAGIGVNVNEPPGGYPGDLRLSAASLSGLAGRSLEREALLPPLLAHLDSWYALWEREGAAGSVRRLEAEGLEAAPGPRAREGALDGAAAAADGGC